MLLIRNNVRLPQQSLVVIHLIPSSIHEMIVIKSNQRDYIMEHSIQNSIYFCNSDTDIVAPEDVLSNNFYYYCDRNNSLSTIIGQTVS